MRIYLILASFCWFNFSFLFSQKDNTEFVYAAYNAGYTMKNIDFVNKLNFSDFKFYYLMCYPKWVNEDFDRSLSEILDKYVYQYEYPKDSLGCGLAIDFIRNAHAVNSKVILSLQGVHFEDIANDFERSKKFAEMLSAFISKFNYDGFDLDWEGNVNLENHCRFLQLLRSEFDKKDSYCYITTALPTSAQYPPSLANKLSEVVDWINIMTYDMGGGTWDNYATYNTPMLLIESRLKSNWSVFPKEKLCIGLAAYGFYYKNLKPGERIKFGQSMKNFASYISYSTCLDSVQNSGWFEKWDAKNHVPYYYSPSGNSFISCDNPRSIQYKINWVKQNGYKGVFWWELYHDFYIPSNVNSSYGIFELKDSVSY